MFVEERTWYLYRGRGLLKVAGPIGRGSTTCCPFLLVPPPRVNLVPCINTTSAPQQPYFIPHIQPLKMELIECSETSAYNNKTPGKYPKEYIHLDSKHGESLKSKRYFYESCNNNLRTLFVFKTEGTVMGLLCAQNCRHRFLKESRIFLEWLGDCKFSRSDLFH
jgi:hypothetical protein